MLMLATETIFQRVLEKLGENQILNQKSFDVSDFSWKKVKPLCSLIKPVKVVQILVYPKTQFSSRPIHKNKLRVHLLLKIDTFGILSTFSTLRFYCKVFLQKNYFLQKKCKVSVFVSSSSPCVMFCFNVFIFCTNLNQISCQHVKFATKFIHFLGLYHRLESLFSFDALTNGFCSRFMYFCTLFMRCSFVTLFLFMGSNYLLEFLSCRLLFSVQARLEKKTSEL